MNSTVLGLEAHFTHADHARAITRERQDASFKGVSEGMSTVVGGTSSSLKSQRSMAAMRRAEVRATAQRIRKLQRGHLNPRGNFVKVWDVIVIIALWYVTFVTPVEVCFWDASEFLSTSTVLMVLNRLMDVVFVLDMLITFFVPYRASRAEGGLLITDNRRIAMHYLKGWFGLDLFTSIPYDLIVEVMVVEEADVRARTWRRGTRARTYRLWRAARPRGERADVGCLLLVRCA